MSDASDTRDRVIALETDMKHLTAKVDDMSAKVNQMHELLVQARGIRWFIVMAAAVGGFVSAKIAPLIPWLHLGPR